MASFTAGAGWLLGHLSSGLALGVVLQPHSSCQSNRKASLKLTPSLDERSPKKVWFSFSGFHGHQSLLQAE